MNNYHYTNMSSVLIWFLHTFNWIRQFVPSEWKPLEIKYYGKCCLCNTTCVAEKSIYYHAEVGVLHPECHLQLTKLEQFLSNEEKDLDERYSKYSEPAQEKDGWDY